MTTITLPDGTPLDVSENPTPEQIGILRRIQLGSKVGLSEEAMKSLIGDSLQKFEQQRQTLSQNPDVAMAIQQQHGAFSDVAQAAGRMAKTTALPATLGTAGFIGGSALGGPFLGIPAEAALSAGGEKLNQLLGITEPSTTQVALAGAAPGVFRGLAGAGKMIAGGGLKALTGKEAFQGAAQDVLSQELQPQTPAAALYGQLKGVSVDIPVAGISKTIQGILQKESGQAPTAISASIEDALRPYDFFFQPAQGATTSLELPKILTEIRRLGQMSGSAYETGNKDLGRALSQVRNSILDALDTVGGDTGQLVRQAGAAYRKEEAVQTLLRVTTKARPVNEFNTMLREDKLFSGSFSPEEVENIRGILKRLSTVTWSGFSGVMGRGALGVGADVLTGGGPIGGAIGIGAAAGLPELIAQTMATKPGQAILQNILKTPGQTLNASNVSAILGAFVRGAYGATRPAQTPQSFGLTRIQEQTQ